MRIERNQRIYPGWAAILTEEVTDEQDPLLKTAVEMLGTDDLVVNVINGCSYIYRSWRAEEKLRVEGRMSEISELVKEVTGFIEAEGYKVVDHIALDFGRTVKLVIEKDGEKSILPIVNCYYDTDSKGKRTKWHGVVDIRNSPWYKKKRAG